MSADFFLTQEGIWNNVPNVTVSREKLKELLEAYASTVKNNDWLSPVKAEREQQIKSLEEITGNFPYASPKWQYLNLLIDSTKKLIEINKKQEAVDNLREEVLWFAERMELKLKANDHKGHWSGEGYKYLLQRLKEEVSELENALEHMPSAIVIDEAADVANFAMMLADNHRPTENR